MNKYLVEFIGTFFLVFAIGMAVIAPAAGTLAPAAGQFAPIVIGATLMVMVYACGHISGAHFNPAVTIAVWLRGKCATADVPGYIVSQIVAATAAAFAALYLKGNPGPAFKEIAVAPALLAEFLGTFALAWVVLNVATAKSTAGNSNYGLAIGFAVVAMAYAVGGISGGAFNPAVAVGITLMKLVNATDIWIHLVADFAGGIAAALAFKALSAEDRAA